MRAGQDAKAMCTCWNTFKPTWDKIMADPAAKEIAAQAKGLSDQMTKACDGFATSPSLLLVAAAAVSMTLFTVRNPLE